MSSDQQTRKIAVLVLLEGCKGIRFMLLIGEAIRPVFLRQTCLLLPVDEKSETSSQGKCLASLPLPRTLFMSSMILLSFHFGYRAISVS